MVDLAAAMDSTHLTIRHPIILSFFHRRRSPIFLCGSPCVPYYTAFAEKKEWAPALDGVLGEISKTGSSQFEWELLKPVIAAKLEAVCSEYYSSVQDLSEPYEELLKRLLSLLKEFPNAPFTVQRLCELLLDPHRIYATSTRKVTSASEKLLTVSSTVPTMVVAQPKPGTYQAASETQLSQLVGGDGAEAMDVEN